MLRQKCARMIGIVLAIFITRKFDYASSSFSNAEVKLYGTRDI